jgi:endonuclease G, mitochondrial
MLPPYAVIEKTIERYKFRKPQREENLKKLKKGQLLEVDNPERVKLRLDRIANNPLAIAMMAEAEATSVVNSSLKILSTEQFRQLVQERIIGQNDLMGIVYLDYALRASQSVGRVIIRNSQQRVQGYGTGFLVSPRLILTNNHVLSSAQETKFSLIEFNYQTGVTGQVLQSYVYELDPQTFFVTDQTLDYTLVAVHEGSNPQPPLLNFGWNRLIEDQGKAIVGEYVNIIQHPEGEPKQLALRENQVLDIFEDFLQYQTDTAPGSSGSPVFNDQWEVVGLHHSGVPLMDASGNIVGWKANEGIRVSSIVKHIKQQSLTPSQVVLRTELFQATPPSPNPEAVAPLFQPVPSVSPVFEENNVICTIPLQVSISLGQANLLTPAPFSKLTSPLNPTAPVPTPSILKVDIDAAIASDPQLSADLELLERARRGEIPYFDVSADNADRDSYYGSLIRDVSSLNPKELFNRLSQLVRQKHQNQLAYAPSRYVYPWVDIRPDLKIRSIYSELEFEPEQIIREDLQIDLERTARLRELMSRELIFSNEALTLELDLLEAQLPYNCEHSVPQSWFNKKEPMKGDLHHLFACEVNCNSFRGNTPFFEFSDFPEEALRSNCGKSERSDFKFEPENGKGAVARATLYFLLRYPGQINNTEVEYTKERLKVLLQWHQEFPQDDDYERHRNQVVFRKQGNRNPLIDFPEWAQKIDFNLGLGNG